MIDIKNQVNQGPLKKSILSSFNKHNSKKIHLVIPLIFLIVISYVSFFHHPYFFEFDGIYYLSAGEVILDGDGKNVKMFNAPVGGPVIYATLNSFFDDGFNLLKIISIVCGTGIVFVSYYIFKNIFDYKIALLAQLFVAVNPRLHILSIEAMNDILPIFLVTVSLYFITKKNIKLYDLIIIGGVLGVASTIRFQPIFVLIAILIYLFVMKTEVKKKIKSIFVVCLTLIILFSPLLIYNFTTHEKLFDNNANFYLLGGMKFQTPEIRTELIELIETDSPTNLFLDVNLFFKNYFYNLFYHHPNLLFNFDGATSFSIIPLKVFVFIGMIPILSSIIYLTRIKINKNNLITLLLSFSVTLIIISLWGEISHHFFALIAVPILSISILNFQNIKKEILPIIILLPVFISLISIIPLGIDRLLPLIFSISLLNAIFFLNIFPRKIFSNKKFQSEKFQKIITISAICIIALILFSNIIYSYFSVKALLYESDFEERGKKFKEIGEILSKQPGIEESYVMTGHNAYAYYANSKMIYAGFFEGDKDDSLNSYILRENWSDFDIWYSNVHSIPINKYLKYEIKPDYLIVESISNKGEILEILLNPDDPRIPPNFEKFYESNKKDIIIYRIVHNSQG